MSTLAERPEAVRRAQLLEYATIAYNLVEAAVSLWAAAAAGSAALAGFGLDSLIEVTSGAALLWRLHADADSCARERRDAVARKIAGACFLALAAYVTYDAGAALIRRDAPERSLPGIAIAAASVIVMPLLARAKRRAAAQISSTALHADSRQADFCAWLSAILLAGLGAHTLFGWWWMDPAAALVMVPIIAREGVLALRGRTCCDCT